MKKIIPLLISIFFTFNLLAQDDGVNPDKLSQATRAMKERRFREAEEIYRSLLKATPDDMALKQLLSHALIGEKKFMEADSLLRRLQEADTNNAGNYWFMGISAMNQSKDSVALDCYKYYLRKTENNPGQNAKGWLYVGSAYRRIMHGQGITMLQFDDMLYHYKHYLQVNPSDPYAPEIEKFIEAVKPKRPAENGILVWDESN